MCHSASDRQIIDCEAPALIRPALNLISRQPDDRFSLSLFFSPGRHRDLGVNTSARLFVCLLVRSSLREAHIGWTQQRTAPSLYWGVCGAGLERSSCLYVSNHACMQCLLRILVAKVKGRQRHAARVAAHQLQIEFCNRPLVQNFDSLELGTDYSGRNTRKSKCQLLSSD